MLNNDAEKNEEDLDLIIISHKEKLDIRKMFFSCFRDFSHETAFIRSIYECCYESMLIDTINFLKTLKECEKIYKKHQKMLNEYLKLLTPRDSEFWNQSIMFTEKIDRIILVLKQFELLVGDTIKIIIDEFLKRFISIDFENSKSFLKNIKNLEKEITKIVLISPININIIYMEFIHIWFIMYSHRVSEVETQMLNIIQEIDIIDNSTSYLFDEEVIDRLFTNIKKYFTSKEKVIHEQLLKFMEGSIATNIEMNTKLLRIIYIHCTKTLINR